MLVAASSEAWFSHRGALRAVEGGKVGEVPVLGGDVRVNLNGDDGGAGDAVAVFDLYTDNGEGKGTGEDEGEVVKITVNSMHVHGKPLDQNVIFQKTCIARRVNLCSAAASHFKQVSPTP